MTLLKRPSLCLLALLCATTTAHARDLTVVSFGGTYQDMQREIYFKPFTAATKTPILEESWDGGYGVITAKMATPPANWDVVNVESAELLLGCADGLYEKLDWAALGGKEAFLPQAVSECGVGTNVWSTGMAYDSERLTTAPKTWADFWDTKTFPGKRALRRGPRYALEFALMADGVPAEEIYTVLATPEGVDRAFAKLDEIKGDLVWWEAGAQPFQLLNSGEVVMSAVWNGRLTGFNKTEGKKFRFVWPGSLYAVDHWVVLKDSPNKEAAMEFVKFASAAENQAKLPSHIAYGVTNLAANALVAPADLAELPTAPENMVGAVPLGDAFWVENIEALTERFNTWVGE